MALAIAPAVDVAEKEKEYEITAELPGMDEKNIEIKLSNGTLTIKGEVRSFQVPEGVDTGKIEATFAKGVLNVKLPKTTEAQKSEKTISVKAA